MSAPLELGAQSLEARLQSVSGIVRLAACWPTEATTKLIPRTLDRLGWKGHSPRHLDDALFRQG